MAALGVVILGAVIISALVTILRSYWRFYRAIEKIPGPRAMPFIGNVHQLKKNPDEFFEQVAGVCVMYQKGMRMIRLWLCNFAFILIYGAEEAEKVLTSQQNIDKSRDYDLLQPWLGQGLLTSAAQKWRPRRKQLTPTFHYDILKDFVDVYSHHAQIMIEKLTPFAVNNEVVNVYRINDIIHERQKKPWLWSDFVFRYFGRGVQHEWCVKTLHAFTEKVIDDRHEQHIKAGGLAKLLESTQTGMGGKRRLAFLDLLLDMVDQGNMPREDVRDEVTTFMFEGHDTTSAGMNWALHLIGTDERVQKKVQEELEQIFGNDDRPPTFQDLSEMKYLECCIKEALRLYPSVPLYARGVHSPITIKGIEIPAGATVVINPFMVHRDPKHWEDPEMFVPERFLPENTAGRHPFAYLPFSAGARNCIGQRFAIMEEKTIISWFLRYFHVKSVLRRDQMRTKAELILRPVQGVPLKLTLRRPPPFVSINNNEATEKIVD